MPGLFDSPPDVDTLALISCSKRKLPVPAPARYLYGRSVLFGLAYQRAVKTAGRILILSAEFGVVDPRTWVAPYDTFLKSLSPADKKKWLRKVIKQMPESRRMVVYAGGAYEQLMLLGFPAAEFPLSGLRLGDRGAKLKTGKPLLPNGFPADDTLRAVYDAGEKGLPVPLLRSRLIKGGMTPGKADAEVRRAFSAVYLHTVENGRVRSKAWGRDVLRAKEKG